MTESVYFSKRIVVGLGNCKHLLALSVIQELTVLIQQFESVPLLGIVRSGYDDTSAGLLHDYGKLGGRG